MSQTGLAKSVFLAHRSELFKQAVESAFLIFEGNSSVNVDNYVQKIWHEVEANFSEYSEDEKIQIATIYADQEVEKLFVNGESMVNTVESDQDENTDDDYNDENGFEYFSALFIENLSEDKLLLIWENECQRSLDPTATVESACVSALDMMELGIYSQGFRFTISNFNC